MASFFPLNEADNNEWLNVVLVHRYKRPPEKSKNQKRHSLKVTSTDLYRLHFFWKDKEATN